MTLAFLLDEDVSPRAAEGLLRLGIDAQTVHGLGLSNLRTPHYDTLARLCLPLTRT